jgi:O-antigen/teichoic acid export membrane protein
MAWMYVVQASSFVLPLLTTPYLARVLGAVHYGQYIYAYTMGQLVSLLVEYGFDFTGTRAVATASSSRERWEMLNGVTIAKLMLLAFSVAVGWFTIRHDPVIGQVPSIVLGVFLIAATTGIHFNWFYQGIEHVALAGKINIAVRFISTAGIFLFVRHEQDVFPALCVFAMGNILSSCAMYLLLLNLVSEHTFRPSNPFLLLKNGFNIFISTFLNQLQLRLITLLVGFFNPGPLVGYFGGAYRLAVVITQATHPITLVVYPRIASMVSENHPQTKRLWTIVFVGQSFILTLVSITFIFFSRQIIHLMLGPDFLPAVPIFCWYVIAMQLVITNRLLLNLWAVPNGYDRIARNLYLCSSSLNITAGAVFSYCFPGTAVVMAICAGELFLLCAILCSFLQLAIWPFVSLNANHLTLKRGFSSSQAILQANDDCKEG